MLMRLVQLVGSLVTESICDIKHRYNTGPVVYGLGKYNVLYKYMGVYSI